MPKSMIIENFVNACETRLRRVEGVTNKPLQLEAELEKLEEFLRNDWSNAILEMKEVGLSPDEREKIQTIFEKIKRIELNTKIKVSLFDGLDDFLKRSGSD